MIERSVGIAVVRGGGDLTTGIIYRLWKVGFSVLVLETSAPLVVRRTVAVASAVFDGGIRIENMNARLINSIEEFSPNHVDVSVFVDPDASSVEIIKPDLVIDAIMAKKNLGTKKDMAPLVIGIGPGFQAPEDVHAVVETKRGHTLGRVIREGTAIPNTGIPGMIRGYTVERLLRAPCNGFVSPIRKIGDEVCVDETIVYISGIPVKSRLDGVLRGLIHPTIQVTKGLKIGDIDPRGNPEHCYTITDKALAIAGGVLEAIMSM